MSAEVREYLIVNYEYGVYRVKLTAYGNTTDGREFILDVPEYSFLSEEPEPVAVVVEGSVDGASAADGDPTQSAMPEQAKPDVDDEMSTSTLVSLIVGINLFILIVGAGLIWWLTLEKKPSLNFMKRFKKSPKAAGEKGTVEDPTTKTGFFAKLFKRKPKEVAAVNKPMQKSESDPGFMDLSIPKE
jgi:hypothetical protein